ALAARPQNPSNSVSVATSLVPASMSQACRGMRQGDELLGIFLLGGDVGATGVDRAHLVAADAAAEQFRAGELRIASASVVQASAATASSGLRERAGARTPVATVRNTVVTARAASARTQGNR